MTHASDVRLWHTLSCHDAETMTTQPDAVFDRAVAAGATVLRPMVDQDHGGRGGTVADPEGNTWSVGDYQPGA